MLGGVDIEVKLPQDLIDLIPQERITGDLLRGHGPRRGNLEALLKYWRPIMRKPGGFRRCIVILANHPELYPLQRICAWLHHETTGKWPNEGNHHGVRRGGGTTGRVLRRAIPGKRKRRRGKSEAGVEIASWRIYRRLGGMATRPIHGSQNAIEYKAARFKQGCKSVPMPGSFEWDEGYPRYTEVETVQDLIDVKLFGGLRGGLVRSHGRSGRMLQSMASFFVPGDMGKYRNPGRSLLWGALTPGGGGIGGGRGGGGGIGGGIGGGLTPIAAARALRCPSGYINGGRFTDPKLANCGGMVFDAPEEGPGAVTAVDREKMTRRLESAQAEDLPDIAREIIINKPQGNPFAVIRQAAIQPTTRPNKKRREGSVKDVLAFTSQKKNQTRLIRRDGAVFEPTIGPEELARIDHDNLQEAVYVTSNIPKGNLGGDEVRLLTRGVKAIEYSFPEGSVRLERTKEMDAATAAKMRVRWGGLRRHAIGSHDPTEAIMRLAKEFQDSLSVKAWFMEIPGANDRIVVYSVTGERKIVARWVFVLYLSLRAPRRPRGTVKPFSMVPPREEEGGPTKSEYWRPERGPFVTVERKSLALDSTMWREQKNVSSIRINTKWGFEKDDLIDFKAAKFDKVLEDPDLRIKLMGGLRRRIRGRGISGMARRMPKVVPYNPNARDADIDGLVQEGTIWERPKGTRFANLAAGARRAKIGSYLVNAQGERVDYTPGEHRQSPLRKYPDHVSPASAIQREKLRQRLAGRSSEVGESAEGVIDRRDIRADSVADFTYHEMLQERRRLKRQRVLRRIRTQPEYRERRAGRLYDRAERGLVRGYERGERADRRLLEDERRRVEEEAAAAQRTAARQARREMSLRFRDENVELDAGVALEDELPSARERRERVGNLIARQNRERAELDLESPSALRRLRGERVIRRGERREERRTPVLNLRSMSDEDLTKERSAIFRRHYGDLKRRGTYTGIADLPEELQDVERELRRRDLPGPWQDDQGERELRGPSSRDRITAGMRRARARERAARAEREKPEPFTLSRTGYGRGPKSPPKPWVIEEDKKRQQRDDRVADLVRGTGKRIRALLKKKSYKKTYEEEKKKVAEESGMPLERADGQMLLFSMPSGLIPEEDSEIAEALQREFLRRPTRSDERAGRSQLRETLWPTFMGSEDDDAEDLSESDIQRLREAGIRVSGSGAITGTTNLAGGVPDPVGNVDLFDLIGNERLGRVLMHVFKDRVKKSEHAKAAFANWVREVEEARGELEYNGIADPEKDLDLVADAALERVIRGLPNAFLSTPDTAEGARVLKEVQKRLSAEGLWDYGMVPERIREAGSLGELIAVLEKNLHYSTNPAEILVRLKHLESIFDGADRALLMMPADLVADLARGDWVDEDTDHTREEFLSSRLFQLGIVIQREHVVNARRAISDLTTRLERGIEAKEGAEAVPEVRFLPREMGFARHIRRSTGAWVSRALEARTGRGAVRRQEEMDRWGFRDYGVDMEGALAHLAATGELPDGVEERITEMIEDAFLLGRVIVAPHDKKLRFVILADGVDPTGVDFRNIDPKDAAEVVVTPHLNYGQPQIDVSIRGVIYSEHVGALTRQDKVLVGGWAWQETGDIDRDVSWRRSSDDSGVVGSADFLSLGLDDGADIEVRGKGFASVINTHAHMALKAAGVRRIDTNASHDGRVVWGRMGYRDHFAERRMIESLESELAHYRGGTGTGVPGIPSDWTGGLILHDRMAGEIEELIEAYHNRFVGDRGGLVSLMMAHAILGRGEDGNSQRHPWEDESEADGSQSKYFTWWMRNAPVGSAYLLLDGEYGELLSEAIGEDRDIGLVDPPLMGAPGDRARSTRKTEALVEQAVALRRSGLSYPAIGEMLGINAGTAHRWIGDSGAEDLPTGYAVHASRKPTADLVEQAVALRRSGLSWDEIGETLGVSGKATRRWIKKFSGAEDLEDLLSSRSHILTVFTPEVEEEIRFFHGEGFHPEQIAEALDIKFFSLRSWLFGQGLLKSPAEAFADGLAALSQFTKREGHSRPLMTHVEDDYLLGTWIGNVRSKYWRQRELDGLRRRRGTEEEQEGDVQRIADWEQKVLFSGRLSDSEIAELEALPGWRWTMTKEDMRADYARGIRGSVNNSRRLYSDFVPHEAEAPHRYRGEPGDPPLTGAPGDGEDPDRFEGDEVLNDVRRQWQEYLRTISGDAKQQLGMLRAMEVDLLGDPNNPDDPWDMGDEGPPAWWVDGLPPPEPPRVVQGYRDRLEDLETLLDSWETPPKEALGMIQLLRAALDDHDRRYAEKEGVEQTREGVRFRADETSPQRDWNQAARVGGPMYEVDLKRAVTEMTWQEIEQSMNAYIVLDEARDETDSRYRLSEEVPEWTPEEVAYREELKAEFAKREAHPDFAYGTGPNGSRTEEDYRREEEYEHEKDVGKTRGRWEYREGRRNEFRAMSDEELEKEYERILADNDEVVEAGEYEYGERYDVRPPMAVWKDGVRMEDRKGGMTGFHADDLTDLETVMEERSFGTKPFVLRTATPREKDAKMKENRAEMRRLIGQPDSKYPLVDDVHQAHRDTGEPFGGMSIEDEMTVRRLDDEYDEINMSFPSDYDGDVDPDTLKEVVGKLTGDGDGGAQVVDPSEFMPPSSPSEDAERTVHIYEQALRRYQTMNDEDLTIERDGLWRKAMRWREAGHEPKMSDQLKLAAATNEMESRGESLGDEVEDFLKDMEEDA